MNNSVEARYNSLRSIAEECIEESELRALVENKTTGIRCYDGFEPSGRMHIAQGIFKAINVNKCTDSGCTFCFWVADWFALMNDKVGGSLENITIVGRYFIEVWKAAGMRMDNVEFLWTSEQITSFAEKYWKHVLDVGRLNTVARIKKCCTIMGKQEGTLTGAQVLYPLMQCSDIFFLKADICQLGLDQRKVNMLAREYCDLIRRKNKPIILSHHMLSGLQANQAKMSKSSPDSAIFMEDSAEDVIRKISQAHCPKVSQVKLEIRDDGAPQTYEGKNPILDYYECLVFSRPDGSVTINGKEYKEYSHLETAFINDEFSEEDLKSNLARTINVYLDPVRHHFATNPEAHEILEKVKSFAKIGPTPSKPYQPSETPLAFVWVPCVLNFSLDACLSIVKSVNNYLNQSESAAVKVILPDLSSFVSNEMDGNEKYINAVLQHNVTLLKAFGLSERAEVQKESEPIFSDTSYWVTTINVGRKFRLNDIESTVGPVRNVGTIIGSMMKVSFAAHLKATHVLSSSFDRGVHSFTSEFTEGIVSILPVEEGTIPILNREWKQPSLAGKDDIIYANDADTIIRKKIKKAYCAPNESENPVIALACFFIQNGAQLSCDRGAEHGGSVSYTSVDALVADSASGALHPGDLKSMVTEHAIALCREPQSHLKTPEMKNLSQTLQAAEKKMSKK